MNTYEKENIVIAGANSFIARHLLQTLDCKKYNIFAVVRAIPDERYKVPGVHYIKLEMKDYSRLGQYVPPSKYYLPFSWDGTKREDRNNELKNRNSYECILESIRVMIEKCGCRKIILPGTFSEYGEIHIPIVETMPCNPILAYGKYKYLLAQHAREICEDRKIEFVEARLFSIYGVGDSDDKMLNCFIRKMLRGDEIETTKAEQIWDFIHVRDVAEAFVVLLEKTVENGCYNVASGNQKTLRYYIEKMKKLTESGSRICYGAIPYQMGDIPHVICNIDKIRVATGWQPKINFDEGLREVIQDYKERI